MPRRMGVSARAWRSALGRAKATEATALPWQPKTLAQIAPSMRFNATSRPPASQTATVTAMFNSPALAIAPATTRLASSSVSAMNSLQVRLDTRMLLHLGRARAGQHPLVANPAGDLALVEVSH